MSPLQKQCVESLYRHSVEGFRTLRCVPGENNWEIHPSLSVGSAYFFYGFINNLLSFRRLVFSFSRGMRYENLNCIICLFVIFKICKTPKYLMFPQPKLLILFRILNIEYVSSLQKFTTGNLKRFVLNLQLLSICICHKQTDNFMVKKKRRWVHNSQIIT